MIERTGRVSKFADPVAFVVLVAAVPWFGWLPLLPVIVGFAVLQVLVHLLLSDTEHAELHVLIGLGAALGGTCCALILCHPAPLYALPLLTILSFSNAAAMPWKPATAVSGATAVAITLTAYILNAHAVESNPSIIVFPLALLGSISCFGYGIGQSTVAHLNVAVTDQLTGMLNRAALASRVAELAHRIGSGGEPVAMLIADLDCFKAINDEHGHDAGDRVLAEVADRIRGSVRLFDSVYRIGGEEFLVLMVGIDRTGAVAVGERIRAAVRRDRVAGLPVTISIGISTCGAGTQFDYEELFAVADSALLDAKARGRDRVLAGLAVPTPLRSVAA
jgi:diguanylate cyclase (GGDEF)-like protein